MNIKTNYCLTIEFYKDSFDIIPKNFNMYSTRDEPTVYHIHEQLSKYLRKRDIFLTNRIVDGDVCKLYYDFCKSENMSLFPRIKRIKYSYNEKNKHLKYQFLIIDPFEGLDSTVGFSQ